MIQPMKSLKEVTEITGLSRRMIQEIETAGLAKKPTSADKYGHLLYDDKDIENLWDFRFYKEIGCTLPEIKKIREADSFNRSKELERLIEEMIKKRDELNNLIEVAKLLKDMGVHYSSYIEVVDPTGIYNFNEITSYLGMVLQQVDFEPEIVDVLTEEEEDIRDEAFDLIMECCDNGKKPTHPRVQFEMERYYAVCTREMSDSLYWFKVFHVSHAPGEEMGQWIDKEYGEGKAKYFYEAMQHYCQTNPYKHGKSDERWAKAWQILEAMAQNNYPPEVEVVQKVVGVLYSYIYGLKIYSEETRQKMFRHFCAAMNNESYLNMMKKQGKEQFGAFLAKATAFYCKQWEEA